MASRSRSRSRCGIFRRILLLLLLLLFTECGFGADIDALLALKSSMDPSNTLQWRRENSSDVCKWRGVKGCIGGARVSKLVLENVGLSGTLDGESLNRLDQLRVLSLKQNSISGEIPDLSGLANLKSLYLSSNNFTGNFPASVANLHRLKILVLSSNRLSGGIPESLVNLRRLYILYLDDNGFTGEIPPLDQTSLRFFNVSNNRLSGQVPVTPALLRFNASSYSGNADLCIPPCNRSFAPPPTPAVKHRPHHHHRSRRWILWVTIGTGILLLLLAVVLLTVLLNRRKNGKNGKKNGEKKEMGVEVQEGIGVRSSSRDMGGFGGGKQQGGFSWEGGGGSGGDGVGTLVFCGDGDQPEMSYSLEDLLKASAETLGRGTMGSTYKAVMESGYIVTVKRLKDGRYPRVEEFRRHIEVIGKLRHPNLVPLRAYFQARDERLLVYDYFPNGSLFSLIHGSRSSASGKPLHWTSCLKIAEDLASGLLYIHQNPGLTHGNLKSSNVLLGSDFESCLTDYGLMPFKNPASPTEESSASSLYYRAPECRDIQRSRVTQQADVYSFGVLLLELLTGKTPFQDLVSEHGSDIPRWVKSVREEAEYSDEPASSGNEASDEKLGVLLSIAMSCVSFAPENRPVMREVLRMIKEIRAEAQVSSNSSDHSPGRWSDTVQSLPRDDHLSI